MPIKQYSQFSVFKPKIFKCIILNYVINLFFKSIALSSNLEYGAVNINFESSYLFAQYTAPAYNSDFQYYQMHTKQVVVDFL